MSALAFPRQDEPALVRSFALAALVHLLLFGVMFLGVRWQIHRPDTVTVELWDTPPAPAAAPLTATPPPKAEPAPRIEKPVIALKEKAEKPKPKAEPKPKPAAKPKPDPVFDKRLREQVAQEQKAVEQDRRERALRDLLARQQSDARSQALATWVDKIRSKIRSNISLQAAEQVAGNPEAVFDVSLLPTGDVLNASMRKSSGNKAYDEAVKWAILKSSPLPKPEQPSVFERQLELRFRPQDR